METVHGSCVEKRYRMRSLSLYTKVPPSLLHKPTPPLHHAYPHHVVAEVPVVMKIVNWSIVWLGGVAVGRRISDREVASSIPGCSAARCNSGQVVHTHVPLFTKQYKLVPAAAGGKVQHRSSVGYAGSHSADLAVGGQPAPLQHCSYRSRLPLYSGLDVTSVTYAAI